MTHCVSLQGLLILRIGAITLAGLLCVIILNSLSSFVICHPASVFFFFLNDPAPPEISPLPPPAPLPIPPRGSSARRGERRVLRRALPRGVWPGPRPVPPVLASSPPPRRSGRRRRCRLPAQRDRKSTRLNSSHLVISYAVFCLKKKKRQEHRGLQAIHGICRPNALAVVSLSLTGRLNMCYKAVMVDAVFAFSEIRVIALQSCL